MHFKNFVIFKIYGCHCIISQQYAGGVDKSTDRDISPQILTMVHLVVSESFRLLPVLDVLDYPWEIDGMDFVIDPPKSSKLQYTVIFILVCHLNKMAHFISCHK